MPPIAPAAWRASTIRTTPPSMPSSSALPGRAPAQHPFLHARACAVVPGRSTSACCSTISTTSPMAFARRIAAAGFSVRMNEPYSGLDGLIFSARSHGRRHGLRYLELEINNRLLRRDADIARASPYACSSRSPPSTIAAPTPSATRSRRHANSPHRPGGLRPTGSRRRARARPRRRGRLLPARHRGGKGRPAQGAGARARHSRPPARDAEGCRRRQRVRRLSRRSRACWPT